MIEATSEYIETWNVAQTGKVTEPGGRHDNEGGQDCEEYMWGQCEAPYGYVYIGE